MKPRRQSFWLSSSLALFWLATTSPMQAQIVQDATLPNPSIVTLNGNTTIITGGTQAGSNLFHSFREFSVLTNGVASFQQIDQGMENVISRVTGFLNSNINGLIEVRQANGTVSSANFFLLNPNGIIFGPKATLAIGGSIIASTASSLDFADGTSFSATNSQTKEPLLTVSTPIGLQFGRPAGSIQVQEARIEVPSGKTLGLVGGDLTLVGGRLTAEGGRIELGSIAGVVTPGLAPVQISLSPINKSWILGYEGVQNFQNIQLSQEAEVNASGEGGGDIQVRGGRVRLTGNSQIVANTRGADPGGTLAVTASESVELIGNSTGDYPSGLFTQVNRGATGTGGNLTIVTEKLIVRDGAQVASTTNSIGDAGNLTVRATDVELVGAALSADAQLLTNEIGLHFPSGLFAGTGIGSRAAGGTLIVETDRLSLRDGAVVQTSTLGEGDAGDLTVQASESVELIGTAKGSPYPTSLIADAEGIPNPSGVFEAKGRGGDLRIETGELIVRDGAAVTVSSLNSASDAKGAGNIDVTTQTIRLDNQGAIIAESRSGKGGDITLENLDLLLLRRNSNISTNAGTTGVSGTGGNIFISNAQFIVAIPSENSDIKANAFLGQGGRVTINAQSIFGLAERNLEDLQTLLGTKDPTQLDPINLPSSDITAISLTDPSLSGQVTINTPDVDPSRGLVALPTDLVDASGLIAQNCPADGGATASKLSEFIITGRGGLPPSPNDALSSQAVWQDLRSPAPQQVENRSSTAPATNPATESAPTQIVEAQGWIIGAKGEVILTATAPTVTFQIPWLPDSECHAPAPSSKTKI